MRITSASIVLPLIHATSATPSSPEPQAIFSNPPSTSSPASHRIPSIHESAIQARRILHISNIATLSTTFPPSTSPDISPQENRPGDVANAPIGLMEYYASCPTPNVYDPTILGVTIATTMKNAASGSNVTLSLRYQPPPSAPPRPDDPWAYLPANLPRFALIGSLERMSEEEVEEYGVRECFIRSHPEAKIWEPGTDIHESWWGRLVVREVYFFGGFGDRARIGWIPIQEWRGVTEGEVEGYRLVGEEGYEEFLGRKGWEGEVEGGNGEEGDEQVFRIQPVDL